MRYTHEQVGLAFTRYREVTGTAHQSSSTGFFDWLGVSTHVRFQHSVTLDMPILEVGEELEPYRINLLLSPHYHTLMKAWFINHPKEETK